MNLAALWTHERARVGAQPEDPQAHSGNGNSTVGDDRRGLLKRQSSNSSLGGAHAGAAASPTAAGGGVKKKMSISIAHREVVYRKLMEESALPVAGTSTAVPRVYDCNEFAMEYADRAPKRFIQQQTPVSAFEDAGNHSTGEGATYTANSKAQQQSNKRRSSNNLAPVTSRTAAASVAAPGAQQPRRHPRKRGGGANGSGLELAPQAFKPYIGDMFSTRGDYVDGMLYMSRMKRSHQFTFGHDGGTHGGSDFGRSLLKETVSDALSAAVAAAAAGNLNLNATDGLVHSKTGSGISSVSSTSVAGATTASASLLSEISPEEILQLKQRQRCSLTLSNWSSNPENARLMVQENVVQALILLCKASENDRVTKLNCVTTLMNLSHVDELRSEIVEQGAVKTLVDIANEADDDKTLRTASAITLCNLCCCLEGEEEILVEDGAVSALSLLINEHPKTSRICLGALFNLTSVKEPYHKIESVLKVFLTLASSSSPATSDVEKDEIIAKAICNLSNFKRVRLRLMEEGIVSAVSNLIHPHHPQIQQLLSYVLLNLSAMRACRSELVAKGCIGALIALTGATSPQDCETKCIVGLALWNLSKETGNRLRMVFEGLLPLVNEICRGIPAGHSGESVRTVCARAIYNVSCSEDTRHKLVERDAVGILSSLSQRCSGDDGKKMCTLALCNLLSVQQAAADIVTAGAITSLIEFSMVTTPPQTLETRQLFSKALSGLCEMSSTRVAVVQANIIPALIQLSSTSASPSTNAAIGARQASFLSEIRARCTAALACLAADEGIAPQVCTPDVVRCVSHILAQERFNIAIERFCCACLSLLCRDEQCAQIVAEEGAIQAVLSTCLESQDLETKESCCHVLASMSCHPSCCMALVKTGVLPVLATLSKMGNSKGASSGVAQRCCAITLANLSADTEIREVLVTSRIVPLLALLSNSYSEDSQRDCARVLCNLSSVRGHEGALVREGALGVLMMISMVRALQPATKETCLRAFANLLTSETLHALVAEGIIKVLPAFAGLGTSPGSPSEPTFSSGVNQVVSVLYGKLLSQSDGRHALCLERAALRALIALPPDKSPEGQDSLYETLLCELVRDDELRERSVQAGIVEALEYLATMYVASSTSTSRVALMLFTLAKHEATRQAAGSPGSLATLVCFLSNRPAAPQDCVLYSVSTLCHLAWHESTRASLDPQTVTIALTRLLRMESQDQASKLSLETTHKCLVTLCCLSHADDHLSMMLEQGILTHLCNIVEKWEEREVKVLLALVCILLRQLGLTPMFASHLSKTTAHAQVVIKLFCWLTKAAINEGDQYAALDCADTLCSVTFISPVSHHISSSSQARPSPFIRRQSQPQHAIRGAVAVGSSVPPSVLVSGEVLAAVSDLLSRDTQQFAETRWRCTAALLALSCIADYRHTLVRLGCTRLLVRETSSYEAGQSNSGIDLAVLRCCAGTLCNLTIVSGVNCDVNAQTMIQEDAVPALIQLAKKENEEIREYCTLALSNLSSQSPKVECGAVSALLNLSLHTSHAGNAIVSAQVGVLRPPAVSDERYRQISSLPDYILEPRPLDEVVAKKYEAAQDHASKPPPPQVPTMPADMTMVGGSSSNQASATDTMAMSRGEEVVPRQRKESSVGNFIGISPVSTPVSGSGSSRGPGAEGELRGWSTLSFPKIDPVESRAMSMLEIEEDADPANSDSPPATPSDDDSAVSSPENASSSLNPGDERLESDDSANSGNGALSKLKSKVGANGLSPLARVVIRKTQTSHAINKLKDVRAGTLRGGLSSSTSSLALATVQEAQENGASGQTPGGVRRQASMNKATPLQKVSSMKSVAVAEVSDSGNLLPKSNDGSHAHQTAAEATRLGGETEQNPLAAAAAAAMLYSSGPLAASPIRDASKMKGKSKTNDMPTTKKKIPIAVQGPDLSRRVPVVTTIEEVQTQAKLLGLWS